jgi:hypothetical protein
MKRGGEDSTLFKRLLRRFPRIVASFVFPDGERDQAYSRDIRSNGRNVIPAAKGIRIERGFGRPNGAGELTGLAAIIRDVTKRFEEMRALKQKLVETTKPRGRGVRSTIS